MWQCGSSGKWQWQLAPGSSVAVWQLAVMATDSVATGSGTNNHKINQFTFSRSFLIFCGFCPRLIVFW
jgi:hypothetical protein